MVSRTPKSKISAVKEVFIRWGDFFHSVYVYQTITMHTLSYNIEAEKDLNRKRSTEKGSSSPQVTKPAPQLLIIVDARWAPAAHRACPELAGRALHLL